jgi:hypothetical protein
MVVSQVRNTHVLSLLRLWLQQKLYFLLGDYLEVNVPIHGTNAGVVGMMRVDWIDSCAGECQWPGVDENSYGNWFYHSK